MNKPSLYIPRVALFVALTLGKLCSAQVTLSAPGFDFGYAPQHALLSHAIWIHAGKDSVRLGRIEVACSCTKFTLEKSDLAPGDSACLEFSYDTRQGVDVTVKSLRLHIEGESAPRAVKIVANVAANPAACRPITVSPAGIDLDAMAQNSKNSHASCVLANKSEQSVTLELVAYDSSLISVQLPDSIPAGDNRPLLINIQKSKVSESFATSLTFSVSSPAGLPIRDGRPTRYSVPIVYNMPATNEGK